jgi:hypothetical protein
MVALNSGHRISIEQFAEVLASMPEEQFTAEQVLDYMRAHPVSIPSITVLQTNNLM